MGIRKFSRKHGGYRSDIGSNTGRDVRVGLGRRWGGHRKEDKRYMRSKGGMG